MAEGPAPSDSELIRSIQRGDLSAFDALYARYESWVVSLAVRFCGNRDDALDVLQETFAYFLRKLPGFSLSSGFKTFLYPVVKHLSLDRRQATKRFIPLPPGSDRAGENVSSTGTEDLLAGLSEPHQEILWLRFGEGLDLKEIAAALEIPLGTVKSRLHAALQAARDNLT